MKQSPTPARSWRRTQSPFKKLTVGDEMMLDLAKAWHLGEMLNLPAMQNELIEAFGARYRQMLRENARILVRPEPFVYLRKHVGYWTKCEMFVIDFLAGLARHTGDFLKAEKLGLSYDIVKALQCVRDSFESEPNRPDLIKEGSTFYKVSSVGEPRTGSPLRVLSPETCPSRAASLSSGCERSLMRTTSSRSIMSTGRPNRASVSGQGNRARLSLQILPEHGRGPPSGEDSQMQERMPQSPHIPPFRLRRPSRSSSMTSTHPHTSFLSASTTLYRASGRTTSEEESTDDEGYVYHVLPAEFLRSRRDSHQVQQMDENRGR